jgi:hypothetical protein
MTRWNVRLQLLPRQPLNQWAGAPAFHSAVINAGVGDRLVLEGPDVRHALLGRPAMTLAPNQKRR